MRTQTRTVPPAASFAVGMIGVPEDAEIELDFRLEAVMEGVLVTGTAQAPLHGECARCLEPVVSSITAEFQELFYYPSEEDGGGAHSAGADSEASDDEEEDYYLEGESIDLEPVVRDAIVLALPLVPLCEEDCPGLCVECGVRLADVAPDHSHDDRVDPRWAALGKLAEPRESGSESE